VELLTEEGGGIVAVVHDPPDPYSLETKGRGV
jgi:hypothetical protein